MINPSGREEWIDMAKVFTMLLVIIGHSTYYCVGSKYGGINIFANHPVEYSVMSNFIRMLSTVIYKFHMPFFMVLCGLTFALSYKKENTIRQIVRKKFVRLIIPMVTVSIFLSIPLKYIGGYWNNSENLAGDIILSEVFLFGNSHLWFLESLFLITIVFACIKRFIDRLRLKAIFWILALILSYTCSYFSLKADAYWALYNTGIYFIYFSAGFYSLKYIRALRPNVIWLAASWCIMIIMTLASDYYGFFGFDIFLIMSVPLAFMGCLNMIGTVKMIFERTSFNKTRLYGSLNRHSYEIYLYSDPFNYLLIILLFNIFGYTVISNNMSCISALIIRAILTIVLSYAVIFLITRLKQSLTGQVFKPEKY